MAELLQQRVLTPLLDMTKRYKKSCGALLQECETSRVSFQARMTRSLRDLRAHREAFLLSSSGVSNAGIREF
jgi:hypothetical protein